MLATVFRRAICLVLVTSGATAVAGTSPEDGDRSSLPGTLDAWPGVDLWGTLLHTIREYDAHQERSYGGSSAANLLRPMELESDEEFELELDDGLPTARDRAIGSALGPYITPIASPNISKACQQASQAYMNNILRKEWALKMFDATGKLPDGILEGNVNLFGNWDECLNITATINATDIGGETPVVNSIQGKYCPMFLTKYEESAVAEKHKRPSLGDTLGLLPILPYIPGQFDAVEGVCMPSVCTAQELEDAFYSRFSEGLHAGISEEFCVTKDKVRDLSSGAIVMLTIFALLGLFMLLGTIIDVVASYAGQTPESSWAAANKLIDRCSTLKLRQVLRAFSVYTNGRKLLDTSSTSDTLNCLHGIRFLSNTWVMLGHSYLFMLSFGMSRNMLSVLKFRDSVAFSVILNATVSVDSFFMLSGLLVAYGVMRQLEKTRGKLNIVMFYVHRYIRLTPVMMLVIGFIATLYYPMASGPIWGGVGSFGTPSFCQENWWTNLLYINNFVTEDRQCLGQTWYLANDMQMFIFSPLVLLPLWHWPTFGQIWTIFLICFFTGINAMVTVIHDIGMPGGGDDWLRYQRPWCRAGAYLVGIYTGWILYRIRGKKIHMPSPVVAIGWICSALTGCLIIYGVYGMPQYPPRSKLVIYSMLNRTAWTICLAWVIFACVTGYGGIINDLLSWKAFIPLSRLTYTSYLIHIDIQIWYWLTNKMPPYLDQTYMVYMYLGSLPVIFGVAAVVSLACEAPMIGLEKIIFRQAPPPPRINKKEQTETSANHVEVKCVGQDNAGFVDDSSENVQRENERK